MSARERVRRGGSRHWKSPEFRTPCVPRSVLRPVGRRSAPHLPSPRRRARATSATSRSSGGRAARIPGRTAARHSARPARGRGRTGPGRRRRGRCSRTRPGTSPRAGGTRLRASARAGDLGARDGCRRGTRRGRAADASPSRYAAVDAAMPIGVAPATSKTRNARQRVASCVVRGDRLARTSRPARLNAFEADVIVIPCSAAASDTVAYGTCCAPGYTSGACTSSATTRAPCRSATSASAVSSASVNTRPVGLCGLQSSTARAPAASARSIASRSSASRPPSSTIGAATGGRPVSSITSKNGGYAGVGTTTGAPASTSASSAARDAGEHVGNREDARRRDAPTRTARRGRLRTRW